MQALLISRRKRIEYEMLVKNRIKNPMYRLIENSVPYACFMDMAPLGVADEKIRVWIRYIRFGIQKFMELQKSALKIKFK